MSDVGSVSLERLIIGESELIRSLRALVVRAARSDLPAFIEGETGVGKELVAQGLHVASGRRGRLVAVNTCAVALSTWEDAFFGHKRGGFTGAFADRDGYFAEANNGSLFLDEILDLERGEQQKLLRVVETGVFRPVGASQDACTNARIIAASSRDFDKEVRAGRFRSDLAYRLRGIVIRVPPLRDRGSDIVLLARYFLRSRAGSNGQSPTLSGSALAAICEHDWPGNVRQLRQAILSVAALCETPVIEAAAVRNAIASTTVGRLDESATPSSPARTQLIDALERHAWDTAAAARELDVTRNTVYARLRRFGIEIPRRYHRRGLEGPSALAGSAPPEVSA